MKYLSDGFDLNQIDAAEPEIADPNPIPDNVQLSSITYCHYPVIFIKIKANALEFFKHLFRKNCISFFSKLKSSFTSESDVSQPFYS